MRHARFARQELHLIHPASSFCLAKERGLVRERAVLWKLLCITRPLTNTSRDSRYFCGLHDSKYSKLFMAFAQLLGIDNTQL
jgi:hypothetical protein